jgi:ornithine cyclodeaminase/1-piperideine-2-carboxylate/1-pyrroline-2-carboxylate reductase [NAD(P)H]
MDSRSVYRSLATAQLLDFGALVDALAIASQELDKGQVHCPVRVGVPLSREGVIQSMPASAWRSTSLSASTPPTLSKVCRPFLGW